MIRVQSGALYQWDMNRIIEVDDSDKTVTEIQISKVGQQEAFVMPFTRTGTRVECCVPNILLQEAQEILVCVVSVDAEELRTVTHKTFYVIAKPRPESYVYEESQKLNYTILAHKLDVLSETVERDYAKKADMNSALRTKADLIDGKVPESQLPELGVNEQQLQSAVEGALQTAKESGEFKGEKGDKGDPGADCGGKSVKVYGAAGDGVTDDTAAFEQALAENRLVYVPEGEYLISDTLVIRENCELELAQSAVLKFTQTDKNCITLLRLASLKGNHATICVPYEFSASVLYSSTEEDLKAVPDTNGDGSKVAENTLAVPPFTKWSPQWKMSRYVTDINICKTMGDTYKGTYAGFHYSKTGDTAGKAVSMVCADNGGEDYMWGINMSGLRIAGAFEYGIYIKNSGEAWNHDMRIEAVIDACKTAVYAENCNTAHFNVTFQPRAADNKAVYAEHGIHLVNCKYTDVSSCFFWDWQFVKDGFKRIAMYGSCPGLLVSIPNYDKTSGDISEHIYSENQSNLNNMTFLQESGGSDAFVSKDGKPYFSDGSSEKELTLKEHFDSCFKTDIVKRFTDFLAVAEDTDGTVLNGKGYIIGARLHENGSVTDSAYYGYTGFIPCKKGSVIRARDLTYDVGGTYCKAIFYDADKNYVTHINIGNIVGGSQYFARYTQLADGFKYELLFPEAQYDSIAFVRFTFDSNAFGANPMIAVDEEISYEHAGFLADGIRVKAENVVGLAGGGNAGITKGLETLFPETVLSFDEEQGAHIALTDFEFIEDDEYVITINGKQYNSTAVLLDDGEGLVLPVVGNLSLVGVPGEDTGEPFIFMSMEGMLIGIVVNGSYEPITDDITVKIEGEPLNCVVIKLTAEDITSDSTNADDKVAQIFSDDYYKIVSALNKGVPVWIDVTEFIDDTEGLTCARILITTYMVAAIDGMPGCSVHGTLSRFLNKSEYWVMVFPSAYKPETTEE